MKNVKILISFICLLAFANFGFAQSAKMQEKAAEKVEKINAEIVSVNAEAALTEDQKTKILALEIKRQQGMKEIKKSDATEEEKGVQKKELNKSISMEINKEILTKEQRQARKAAKEASKEEN